MVTNFETIFNYLNCRDLCNSIPLNLQSSFTRWLDTFRFSLVLLREVSNLSDLFFEQIWRSTALNQITIKNGFLRCCWLTWSNRKIIYLYFSSWRSTFWLFRAEQIEKHHWVKRKHFNRRRTKRNGVEHLFSIISLDWIVRIELRFLFKFLQRTKRFESIQIREQKSLKFFSFQTLHH